MGLNGDGFARHLRAVTRDLTQVEIASLAGLTQQDVSRYLRGRIPKAENLLRLSAAFEVSVPWLLTDREPAGPAGAAPIRKPLHPVQRRAPRTVPRASSVRSNAP